MIAFIDEHRSVFGVEPISRLLQVAPSTYYADLAQRDDPAKASARRLGCSLPASSYLSDGWPDRDQLMGLRFRL